MSNMNPDPSQPPASLRDRLFAWCQYPLPHHLLSAWMYRLTRVEIRWFKNLFIRLFQRLFNIELREAQRERAEEYVHFNDFFTRALKPGVRPIDSAPEAIVSPVDGTVSQAGTIQQGRIFQAKGHDYSLEALLGGDTSLCESFSGGGFATIYLSPRDYHRIHIPYDGTLRQMSHIPGRLFSVNGPTTRAIPGLFARNERVISIFDTAIGPMAVIKVGALFVGSVSTVWAGQVVPPQKAITPEVPPQSFSKGDEMARFNMGSTVILLFGAQRMRWEPTLKAERKVRLGERIASRLD